MYDTELSPARILLFVIGLVFAIPLFATVFWLVVLSGTWITCNAADAMGLIDQSASLLCGTGSDG